jgi:1-deoxy-D-xylulose-5-phosphate reductoisomerase
MKLPIAFALLGEVEEPILPSIDLASIGSFSFQPIEAARYPIWEIKEDVLAHPTRGVVINAANEVGIAKFFNQEINILELAQRTIKAYRYFENAIPKTLDEVFEIDKEVRQYCLH